MCKVTYEAPSKSNKKARTAADTASKRGAYGATYTSEDLRLAMIAWYKQQPKSFRKWCQTSTRVSRMTLDGHLKTSGLKSMRDDDRSDIEMVLAVNCYVKELTQSKSDRAKIPSRANSYLTRNEELCIVQVVVLLAGMGHGVSKDDVIELIDEYVNLDEDVRQRVATTENVFRKMRQRHPTIMKIVSAGSLDPARARKATKETRDKVFYKLEAYISTLYRQGKVPWKSYSDIPADKLYNMDEVGSDTTKRRAKVIASANNMARLFQVTPEGDGKMNMHITACITTRADGKSLVGCWGGGRARTSGPWGFCLLLFLICCVFSP
jgi:hypothetical protein